MKLYRSNNHPGYLVGEDRHGVLMVWPAEPRGWAKRQGYAGSRRALEEVEPALARGTGWPFGPVGRKPQADRAADTQLGIRATSEERAAWSRTADGSGYRSVTRWARDELNAAAERAEQPPRPSAARKPSGDPPREKRSRP